MKKNYGSLSNILKPPQLLPYVAGISFSAAVPLILSVLKKPYTK